MLTHVEQLRYPSSFMPCMYQSACPWYRLVQSAGDEVKNVWRLFSSYSTKFRVFVCELSVSSVKTNETQIVTSDCQTEIVRVIDNSDLLCRVVELFHGECFDFP
jgi:hypothetical protein